MNQFDKLLNEYSKLILSIGINIQKNQILAITSPIECAYFTKLLVKHAYNLGAKDVHIEWIDDELTLIKYMNAPKEAFETFPNWKVNTYEELAKEGAAFLSISGSNPELLKNVNPDLVALSNKVRSKALKNYREYLMGNNVPWCVVCAPTKDWACKVYPDLENEKAVEKLWDSIFKITRTNLENPVETWKNHLDDLKNKTDYLNSKKFKRLHFKGDGTDLVIELPSKHIWTGGGEYTKNGTYFVANIPTEEIFTLPSKKGVNGVVKSTKPLNYSGNLIDNFTLTFKDGKIIDFTAEKGYETLKKLIETDEGSCYLGEVALVPHNSPISNLNTIFYNTLFDENASCHLAFGMAYPICLEDGNNMSEQELIDAGANTSLVHVDFMIGSENLDIIGYTDENEQVQIFKNGNWALK
ncbi:aminopeptidase II. Metallo peptidase. MEROPS family M29 [Alkalithermobacter thermoalcaliphilus JW-YL-7 = DSM 7308]|uniref:Aminopeptidase II. Metallo peptidase. MEROPS family M29 n=1 Tax=Alkalithermobacter thermoalcaliphilus JW-YL-7 = DSM 7308 TaxID=1121328 RepID=A0A150FQ68_CLOPD|nr:peptidase M29 aminopeptidase II [[Clostridium] paradoxum JW-YL-7 = DSM 7308]SHK62021.1 aminopeptidase II. Metallo peptidase. MEROPS family M29 [[Clostridium] paradoxum JW-YL-7 = DSM 7308]